MRRFEPFLQYNRYPGECIVAVCVYCGTNCLRATFLAFGKAQEILPGALAIHPGLLLPASLAQLIRGFLRSLPRVVEQIHILRVSNIRRTAGGVQDQCSAVGRLISIIRIILPVRFRNRRLQNGGHIFLAEPLPKRHQSGRPERARPIFLHSDEIFQIRIFSDVFHQPTVTAFQPPLDQPCAQCHPCRMRRRSIIREPGRIPLLRHIPRYQRSQFAPIFFLVQISIREYEIINPQLTAIFIYPRRLYKCELLAALLIASLALIISYSPRICFCFGCSGLRSRP